jgi:hypothetical protein
MKFILLILITLNAHSLVKNLECESVLENTKITLEIVHDTEDFQVNSLIINSSITIKTSTQEQILDVKLFDASKNIVEFKSSTELEVIRDTPFKIVEIFLYDKYLDLDKDDFFFGRFEHSEGGEGKYLSNFSQFGGNKIIIFTCK